jgi:tetratricopeptide (TPR) repeat protein
MNKKSKQKTKNLINPQQISQWFAMATRAIQNEDWDTVIRTCKRILIYTPKKSTDRADALTYLANAYGMQENFNSAYQTLNEALTITPDEPLLWYNRGITDRYLFLIGQSVRDMEQAIRLNQDPEFKQKFEDALQTSKMLAKSELTLRPKEFTLDQLIEQQECFFQGNAWMLKGNWSEAEQYFRSAISMSDCLPSPQGNLGICLMMQRRYDEAKTAMKRALEIDNKYDLAKQNLKILENVRNGAPLPPFQISQPFKGNANVSMSVYHKK